IAMLTNTDALAGLAPEMQNTLVAGGWIGWAVNILLPVFAVFFMLMPNIATKAVRGIVRLGAKLRIVKNEEKVQNKAFKAVKDFKAAFSIMIHHPWRFLVLLLLCAAEVTLVFSLPYFVMRAYNGLPEVNGLSTWFDVITLNVFATLSVTVVPTPGNSGALETILMAAFSKTTEEVLFWVVLTCRSLTYYVYIFVGFGITIFEMIRKLVRKNKEKRLAKLQAAGAQDVCSQNVDQSE
ncbi:MAG: flippase-like domain-containing protein, partial [Clostridia bacterium]|nr:flippase-like domain-containing protein [Clostridia bacterium]